MIDELYNEIQELLHTKPRTIVAVSGFGGSGKTTLAKKIKRHFAGTIWIQLDNFLVDRGEGPGWAGGYDWKRFEKVLQDARAGASLHYQAYDWEKDALTDWYIDQEVPPLTIVEGVRLLQPKLLTYFDFKIWIDCSLEMATAQGKARDRQDGADASHIQKWDNVWAPKEEEFVAAFNPKKIADFLYKRV